MTTSASPPRFWLLVLMAIVSVIPLNMFVPSLPRIADDFGVDYAVVNIAIGGYAIVMAVTQVIGGALSDRFGRRPVALVSLGVFTLASIGCVLAPTVQIFLAFRMLQGVITAGQAVAMAAIRDTYEGPEMRQRIGNISSAWAFGPMLGPTVGGVLAHAFGWRSSFVLFAVLGAITFACVFMIFGETNRQRSQRLLPLEHYLSISKSGMFWGYAGLMALAIGLLYIYLGGAPNVATGFGDLSDLYVGVMLGLLPLGFMIGSAITSRTAAMMDPHRMMLLGRLVTLAGMLLALTFTVLDAPQPLSFFLPCMTIGLGNGLTLPTANAGVLALGGDAAGAALGLATAIQVSGAAFLSSLAGFVIEGGDPRLMVTLSLTVMALLGVIVATSIDRRQATVLVAT